MAQRSEGALAPALGQVAQHLRDAGHWYDFHAAERNVDLARILLGHQDAPHAGLPGRVELFDDAAYRAHLSLDRELARDREVLGNRRLRDRRIDCEKNGEPGGRAVDVSAADDVDVQIEIGDVDAGHGAHDAGRVEDGVFGHRSGRIVEASRPFAGLQRGKGDRFDLDDAPQMMQDAQSEALADLARRAPLHLRGAYQPARANDGAHVFFEDRRMLDRRGLRFARVEPIERLTVRIGNDLHRLASLDRVGRNQRSDAAYGLGAQPPNRALNDRKNLMLRQRREEDLGAARAYRGIDVVGFASCGADQNEVGRSAFFEEPLDPLRNVRRAFVIVRRFEGNALILEHFEQPRLKRSVHFADFVDEEHAAVGPRYQPQFGLRNTGFGKLAAAALIDGVVNAA